MTILIILVALKNIKKGEGVKPLKFNAFCLRRGESNPYRLSAARFGPFHLVVLVLRQQSFIRRGENASKISRRQVQSSFHGANFCPGEKNRAVKYCCIYKRFYETWAEIRPIKPVRVLNPFAFRWHRRPGVSSYTDGRRFLVCETFSKSASLSKNYVCAVSNQLR